MKAGRIELVDGFTGRIADRRQWPWGIQPALEAKEGLEIRPEGRVFGTVTIQHLVRRYPKLCAMTATAVRCAEELHDFYDLATVIVPTVQPVRRVDHDDRVFPTRSAKARALVDEIAAAHATGRPVLVGTGSVKESEELAGHLAEAGVRCEVLNARNDEREAELVAAAGRLGAVTISTNMAGRGTDIRPDPAALALGGLYVIGTNRHDSRRVDDQLRGRSGRQGEPGASRFFVSLEDPLFERYGVREFLPRDLDDPRVGARDRPGAGDHRGPEPPHQAIAARVRAAGGARPARREEDARRGTAGSAAGRDRGRRARRPRCGRARPRRWSPGSTRSGPTTSGSWTRSARGSVSSAMPAATPASPTCTGSAPPSSRDWRRSSGPWPRRAHAGTRAPPTSTAWRRSGRRAPGPTRSTTRRPMKFTLALAAGANIGAAAIAAGPLALVNVVLLAVSVAGEGGAPGRGRPQAGREAAATGSVNEQGTPTRHLPHTSAVPRSRNRSPFFRHCS